MPEHRAKIRPLEALAAELQAQRNAGRRIVQCHGCFDIVHPGHLRYLELARSLGDVLVVSVSADDVVGKGEDRPIVPQALRMENLAALELVDFVCLSEDEWAGPVLEKLRPHVYVKGKEYEGRDDPRFARERAVVEGYGGQVVFGAGDVVFSSSRIIAGHADRFGLDPARVRAFCHSHAIDRAAVTDLLDRCTERSVLVVGDAILDTYVHCEEAVAAAEGPILDVRPVAEASYAGGPGLIAGQAAALGARVELLTAAAPGPALERLRGLLARSGAVLGSVDVDARPVTEKTRYVVGHHKLLKVNRGNHVPIASAAVEALAARIDASLGQAEAVIVADFGYGLFGRELCARIEALCRRHGRQLYADVSTSGRANLLKFARPRLATPTERELRSCLADQEAGLSHLAARYYEQTAAEHLIVTLGRRGALYFHPPAPGAERLRTAYLPALGGTAIDNVGAGDVFLAGAALADLAGAPLPHAMYLGSALAALAIARLGNDPVGAGELREYLETRPDF